MKKAPVEGLVNRLLQAGYQEKGWWLISPSSLVRDQERRRTKQSLLPPCRQGRRERKPGPSRPGSAMQVPVAPRPGRSVSETQRAPGATDGAVKKPVSVLGREAWKGKESK